MRRLTAVLAAFLLTVAGARAGVVASDDFESYAGNPTGVAGGIGAWTTNWRTNSQFDGGTYLNNASKISATNSYGLYGSGGGNGTSVRRAFTAIAGTQMIQWSFRADYNVTSDDGNGSLSRRL